MSVWDDDNAISSGSTSVLGDSLGGNPYVAGDAGYSIAMSEQNSHSSTALETDDIELAQQQINDAVSYVRGNMKGASEEEIRAAVEQSVGSLSLPPNLGQSQIAVMTDQALTQTDTNIFDNSPGGVAQTNEQEQDKGGLFAGLWEQVAPIIATFSAIFSGFGGNQPEQGTEVSLASLGTGLVPSNTPVIGQGRGQDGPGLFG